MATPEVPFFRRIGIKRLAQIALALVAVVAAGAAGFRYFDVPGPGSIFGEHVEATPSQGPVGIRAIFEFPGYSRGQEVTVLLCFSAQSDPQDCANLGEGRAGERMLAEPIPRTFPDGTDIEPGTYALLTGPDREGRYNDRGRFQIVPFAVGERVRPAAVADRPSDIQLDEGRRLARGIGCISPHWLVDGRLAAGPVVIDPVEGTTIDLGVAAEELAWSPDGDKLAILTTDRKEIRLAGPDGSDAAGVITESRGLLSSLSWSPDGDRLAFISQSDPAARGGPGPPTVRILNATTGETTSAGAGLAVAWSPRSDVLAVQMAGGRIEASTPDGGRREIAEGRTPAWSADGRFLAVIRGEGSERRAHVMLADGQGEVAVGDPDTCAVSFSPSGRQMAFVTNVEGQPSLILRSLGG
jgi:hypothetical protein